jgi:hypothetical protein
MANTNPIDQFIARVGLTRRDLANAMGVSESGICRKIIGNRKWLASEAIAVTEFLRQWDPELTVEALFADITDRADSAAAASDSAEAA